MQNWSHGVRAWMCFDREFESGVFAMGKWLRIACFLTSVFLIINVFPHFSRKKNRATSSPESRTHPFSMIRARTTALGSTGNIHRRNQNNDPQDFFRLMGITTNGTPTFARNFLVEGEAVSTVENLTETRYEERDEKIVGYVDGLSWKDLGL